MDWKEPAWWILFLGSCASLVLSLVNIAWTWKQAKRVDEEVLRQRAIEADALRLLDSIREDSPFRWVAVDGRKRSAAMLAKSWGALHIRWNLTEVQVKLASLNDAP